MTMIRYHDIPSSAPRLLALSALVRPLASLIGKLRSDWERRRTERAIEAMPAEMRKDIGWPTADMDGTARIER